MSAVEGTRCGTKFTDALYLVTVVTRLGPDILAIGVHFPSTSYMTALQSVQASSGAHPASEWHLLWAWVKVVGL
jgi:hypothetical protein